MPNKILIKRSDVAARRPTLTDLDHGELFLNTADEQLSIKNKAGTYVKDIIPKAGTSGLYLRGHSLGSIGYTGLAGENLNTGVLNYAPMQHAHLDPVGITLVSDFVGITGKTYYRLTHSDSAYAAYAILSNISVVMRSYWVNSGDVTLSIGTYNWPTSTVIDEEAFLKKISLKSDSPLAYGETISLRNPKGYAGSNILNGLFLNSYPLSGISPIVIVRVPNGGATSGYCRVFTEYAGSGSTYSISVS
jgi:hypothetical protein